MRFLVKRSSTRFDDEAPCPEAERGTVAVWDVRTLKSPEEFDAKIGSQGWQHVEPWLSKGTDHQVVRGPRGGAQGIKRRLRDDPAWYVEIPDLAALLALRDCYGDLIVSWSDDDGEQDSLEIYDGWRE